MWYAASRPSTLAETRKKPLLTITAAGTPVASAAALSASTPASTAETPFTKRIRKITQQQGAHSSSPEVYGCVPPGPITRVTMTVSANEQIRKAAAAAGCEYR